MQQVLAVTLAAAFLAAGSVGAAAQHEVDESIEIAAPAAEVWKRIREFGSLDEWLPGIAACEIAVGEDNVVGAVRLLTLEDGGQIREELLAHDDDTRSLSYSILEAPLPVQGYRSTLAVHESGGGSHVEWQGSFESGPEMIEVFEGIYRAGLGNLKQLIESH